LLTPSVAFEVETGWARRNWGPAERSGFDTTSLALKGLLYKNDLLKNVRRESIIAFMCAHRPAVAP
jgi:hypothetical protein